jgi:hypothetical protein
MKKFYFFTLSILLASLVACSDDSNEPEENVDNVEQNDTVTQINQNQDQEEVQNENENEDQIETEVEQEKPSDDTLDAESAAILYEEIIKYEEIVNGDLLILYQNAMSNAYWDDEEIQKSNLEEIVLPNLYEIIMELDSLTNEISSNQLLGLHEDFMNNIVAIYEGFYDVYDAIVENEPQLKERGLMKVDDALGNLDGFDTELVELKEKALRNMYANSPNYDPVKEELEWYVDIIFGELGDRNLEVFYKYKENQGPYYPGDAEFVAIMTDELLPNSEYVYNELVALSSDLETEEVKKLHQIVIAGMELQNEGFKMKLDGANQQSEKLKKDASDLLSQSADKMHEYREEFERLQVIYDISLDEDFKFIY